MGVLTGLTGSGTSTPNSLWDALSETTGLPTKDRAVAILMDAIISSTAIRAAFETAMISTSVLAAIRNNQLHGEGGNKALSYMTSGPQSWAFGGVLEFLTVAFTADFSQLAALMLLGGSDMRAFYDTYQKALIEPNIEGVPISSSQIVSDREVDVGEQMMIVQSSSQKQYWTDNAVPHLKTWAIEGYLTSQLNIDQFYISKPSLKMQSEFLDICAASRRPVLFKDNKGDFRFVQITSLHTEEVAEYNNAIKVNIQLKEYKPFYIETLTNITGKATKDASTLGSKALS